MLSLLTSMLTLHRQVEMFAGVAASSMPTVHQFFNQQNISLIPRRFPFISALSNMLGLSKRIPDHNPSNLARAESVSQTAQPNLMHVVDAPEDQKEFK